jgi:chemotaxis methyl-accepting protein methylase
MAANSIAKLTDYSEFLRQSPREIDSLFREILGPVTSLIRDAEAWDFIGQIIRLIVTGKQESDAIRVWAPGCATGEELYSLAILFLDALKENANKYELQFCGTDLDEGAIDFARRAVYPASAISTLPGHLVDTYFTRTGDSYQVHTQVRDIVTFARHDVGHDSPLMHLDLISCRNLLMYFKAELQTSIVSTLHASLEPDGYLFLGKHEMLAGFADLFSVYDRRHKIFQRRSSTASHPGRGRHFRPSSPGISSGASRRSPDEMTNEAIAQKYDLSQETLTKIAALEIELGSTQERLQMTTEELEMTNVELQSLNAELQSSNAELQATNEKLITVNQEFNIKASDLAGVNSDLENILNMLEVPVVLLNKEMAVTRFTAAAIDMFDISTAKGGEVVAKIGNKTAQPDLSNDIYSVIATGKPIARDVEGGSKCYLMKITPCLSEHRQICGVMLSFYAYGELPMSFSRLRLKKSGNRQKQ